MTNCGNSDDTNIRECKSINVVIKKLPPKEKKKGGEFWIPTGIAILSLIWSIWGACFLDLGKDIKPISPSGYSIIRGIDSVEGIMFPSDHIVFPLEWLNESSKAVSISNIKLKLTQVYADGSPYNSDENIHTFFLAGTYPEISAGAFAKFYNVTNSVIIQPHGYTSTVLVFHIDGWYDEHKSQYPYAYDFEFPADAYYKIEITFCESTKSETTLLLLKSLQIGSEIYSDKDAASIDNNREPLNFWYLNADGTFSN